MVMQAIFGMAASVIRQAGNTVLSEGPRHLQNVVIADGGSSAQEMADADSSSEADLEEAVQASTVTERRQKQNQIFKNWIADRTEKVAEKDLKEAALVTQDELLSVRSLMARKEANLIIHNPREYQLELFERAKENNIIAVLDTGSGKTLIAVLLLKHVIDKELEDRAKGNRPKISFFLVHSVALVFQQFAVLECNLDQPIERFCGDMNVDSFNKTTWAKQFSDNMAVVCTADILLHCLLKSFITINDINLLIFDEAHKTKKNHAYARIVKDFVISEHESNRPKIFGMTASPIDSKGDPQEAARALENLLSCRIATASDLDLLRQSVSRPHEQIKKYQSLVQPYMTPLTQALHHILKDIRVFEKSFNSVQMIASELGEWAADRFWKTVLSSIETEKLIRKLEQDYSQKGSWINASALAHETKLVKEAQQIASAHVSLLEPFDHPEVISPKVKSLGKLLDMIFGKPNDSRCLVFVTKRTTATLLADLFSRMGNKNMRVGFLIGIRSGEGIDDKVSVRQQVLKLSKFRKGELNILFATSIAEEGLDIPACNAVIRFDLFTTVIQYIQSRGRARQKNSMFISMIEHGNPDHMQVINEAQHSEKALREFCSTLPEDRLLQGSDFDVEEALAGEMQLPVWKEPKTGAKITFGSALGIIEHFVTCLRQDDETTPKAIYIMSFRDRKFVCELIMPSKSPIVSMVGKPYSRKSLAKRSAAFQMSLQLRADGHIDEHLVPIYHLDLPKFRNARLAISSKKAKQYPMKIKPSLWADGWGTLPSQLFLTIIDLESPEVLGRQSAPIVLLTRTPLIDFPLFPVHPRPGRSSNVISKSLRHSIGVTGDELELLSSFTMCFYKDLFNKHYEHDSSHISYWLAPIKSRQSIVGAVNGDRLIIDWDVLRFVKENPEIRWTANMDHQQLEDKFIVDPYDGRRHFFTSKIKPDSSCLDPIKDGSPKHKYMDNILNYSISLFEKSKAKWEGTWNNEQPVLEAEFISYMRNWLDEWSIEEATASNECYICLEPLMISSIPASFVVSGYLLPSVIHRLESYLIAQELCVKLDLPIRPDLSLEALTKDSDNTEEHRETQIQFQRGMGKNYERLEFIGDSFLKMATSIALYAKNARDDEFQSHVKRMLLICNRNLFNTAMDLNIFEYIRDRSFNRRTWYPEGLRLLKGKGANVASKRYEHPLADKTIADVCEALIGASLLSREAGDMNMAVKAVTKLVNNSVYSEEVGQNDHDALEFGDYLKAYQAPEWQIKEPSASHVDLVEQCAKEDPGYRFKSPRLLKAAFTHPSVPFMWENIPNYQRLEFLGDALFDMVAIRYLFDAFPDRDPQWLTEHKMAMVSNKYLGALCVRLGFHKHLRHLNSVIAAQITEYANDIVEAEAQAQGAPDYWLNTRNPPKCLPDVVEAYIGALFVDSGFDYTQVERFFASHVRWYFEDMTIYDTFANAHPTTHLSNLLSTSIGCSNFRLLCEELPTADGSRSAESQRIVAVVMIHDQIVADSEGTSSRYAKIRASQKAVNELQGMLRPEFVKRFGCDCRDADLDEVDGQSRGAVDSAI